MASTVGKTTSVSPSQLNLFHRNPRKGDVNAIASSLRRHTQYAPITANVGTHTGRPNEVLKGNHTTLAFRQLAEEEPDDPRWRKILVFWVDVDDDLADRIVVADNRTGQLGGFDAAELMALLEGFNGDLDGTGYTNDDIAALAALHDSPGGTGDNGPDGGNGGPTIPLADRYGVPPFSVLDRRSGRWQDRKREWLSAGLGLDSHDGRDSGLTYSSATATDPVSLKLLAMTGGTSVFDPLLCEIAYRWHTPEIDHPVAVLDPFAGGPVRGMVAAAMGLHYVGIDVREEQIVANHAALGRRPEYTDAVTWLHGDATRLGDVLPPEQSFDLVFSCPPYGDLECYNDDNDRDISGWSYEDFLTGHATAINDAAALLKDDRFAVWVTSDIRDNRNGYYRGLGAATVDAFAAAGLTLLNEAVIVDPVGTAPIRAARQFDAGRKLVRMHQYMYIFVKGDVRVATEWAKQGREFVIPDDDNEDIADAV